MARRRGRPAGHTQLGLHEDRLLDAAFAAFATRGYEGTTLRQIAKELGVSHNLINVRFGSKSALWRRAVDARVARISPQVFGAFSQAELEPAARLTELVRRFCTWAAANPDFVSLTQIEGRRATWRIAYLAEAYIMPFKLRLDDLLAHATRAGTAAPISTSAFMFLVVQGAGAYFSGTPLLECLHAADEIEPTRIGESVDALTRFIMAGLLGADPAPCA